MKSNIWFIITCALVFCIGYNLNDAAISFPKYKVAIIDISEVMTHSPEIQSLKKEQDKDIQDLNTLISKAQNELLNETDRNRLLKKESTYRKQIEDKKKAIDTKYNSKLSKINQNIQDLVSKEAKKSNYNLVLPTGMVISGGEDITQNVIKSFDGAK